MVMELQFMSSKVFGNHWLKLHIKCHNFPLFLYPKLIMTFQFHYFGFTIRISPIKAIYMALESPILLLHLWGKRRGNERTMRLKLFKSEENNFTSSCIVLPFLWLTPQWSCSVMSNSLPSHGLQPTRFLHPWNFPGKSTGVGFHFLLQGIFPTQVSNPGLPHCRQTLYRGSQPK